MRKFLDFISNDTFRWPTVCWPFGIKSYELAYDVGTPIKGYMERLYTGVDGETKEIPGSVFRYRCCQGTRAF